MPISKLFTVYCQMITLHSWNLDVESSECAFHEVKKTIQDYRDHDFEREDFEMVHKEALYVQDKFDLDPVYLPRVRRLPKKLCGGAATPVIELAQHFRILYHQLIGKIIVELEDGIVPSYLAKVNQRNTALPEYRLQSHY